jgi:hypothetical protein
MILSLSLSLYIYIYIYIYMLIRKVWPVIPFRNYISRSFYTFIHVQDGLAFPCISCPNLLSMLASFVVVSFNFLTIVHWLKFHFISLSASFHFFSFCLAFLWGDFTEYAWCSVNKFQSLYLNRFTVHAKDIYLGLIQ